MAEQNLTDEVRAALEAVASGLPPEVAEAQQAQVDEWSTWVAVEPIYFNGVRAANVGDSLPKANVEKYQYDKLGWAAKRSTKAGKEALDGRYGAAPEQPSAAAATTGKVT